MANDSDKTETTETIEFDSIEAVKVAVRIVRKREWALQLIGEAMKMVERVRADNELLSRMIHAKLPDFDLSNITVKAIDIDTGNLTLEKHEQIP